MRTIHQDRGLIRRFLLGQLKGFEREQLEEKFITDSEYREEILIVEEELLEDYLNDNLTSEDKQQLDLQYLSAPRHQQKLLVARAVKRYCEVEQAAHSPPIVSDASSASKPPTMIGRSRSVSRTAYALAAVLLLVLLAGLTVLLWRGAPHTTLRSELVRLNADPAHITAPGLTITVLPGASRGPAGVPQVSSTGPDVVQLLLVLPDESHRSYRATLRHGGNSESYPVESLGAAVHGNNRTVSLNLPAQLLPRGDYTIELIGLNVDGTSEGVADYSFLVN